MYPVPLSGLCTCSSWLLVPHEGFWRGTQKIPPNASLSNQSVTCRWQRGCKQLISGESSGWVPWNVFRLQLHVTESGPASLEAQGIDANGPWASPVLPLVLSSCTEPSSQSPALTRAVWCARPVPGDRTPASSLLWRSWGEQTPVVWSLNCCFLSY